MVHKNKRTHRPRLKQVLICNYILEALRLGYKTVELGEYIERMMSIHVSPRSIDHYLQKMKKDHNCLTLAQLTYKTANKGQLYEIPIIPWKVGVEKIKYELIKLHKRGEYVDIRRVAKRLYTSYWWNRYHLDRFLKELDKEPFCQDEFLNWDDRRFETRMEILTKMSTIR